MVETISLFGAGVLAVALFLVAGLKSLEASLHSMDLLSGTVAAALAAVGLKFLKW